MQGVSVGNTKVIQYCLYWTMNNVTCIVAAQLITACLQISRPVLRSNSACRVKKKVVRGHRRSGANCDFQWSGTGNIFCQCGIVHMSQTAPKVNQKKCSAPAGVPIIIGWEANRILKNSSLL